MVSFSSVLFTLTTAIAAAASPLYPRAPGVITNCNGEGVVALTFDDGPSGNLRDLVNTLNGAGVKGTFFFNGQNGDSNLAARQADVEYAFDAGHQIASHTWRHADLTTLHGATLEAEFSKTNDEIRSIIGQTPAFMRPPYGKYNDEVLQVAEKYGQHVVNWSFDSGDSTGASVAQSEGLYADAAGRHPNPILALNHETHSTTVDEVVPYAIKVLKDAGYKFVTVAECTGMPAYQ